MNLTSKKYLFWPLSTRTIIIFIYSGHCQRKHDQAHMVYFSPQAQSSWKFLVTQGKGLTIYIFHSSGVKINYLTASSSSSSFSSTIRFLLLLTTHANYSNDSSLFIFIPG